LEDNIRREETPAHVAVREALINLCIHADYTENASLVVRHTANGFIFSNPDTMLVSKEQYYTGGESVCRNKSLQKMFAMLGVAEKAGSGTDKIMKGWKESNWRAPKIDIMQEPDKVVLTMPMESLLSENAKAKLEKKFGFAVNSFDHNVLAVLALASDEEFVNNERLRYSLSLHKSQISELLKLMCQNQLLEPQGYGRGMRYYLPKDKLNVFRKEANITTLIANSATSGTNKVATSDDNSATSENKVVTSHDKGGNLGWKCKTDKAKNGSTSQ
jgi:predicted HTH transcriptional regulator